MNPTRREFVKVVAAAAVLPAVGTGSPAFSVDRQNMWSPDRTSEETLTRCNRLLTADSRCVIALCHRGQVSPFVRQAALAEADMTRAIYLEPDNPALYYIRGVTLNRAPDLKYAIGLLSNGRVIDGRAICTSQPDIYRWLTPSTMIGMQGNEGGELLYMAYRELGLVLEEQGHYADAFAAYMKAAEFETISPADLESWAESSFAVGSFCRAVVEYERLIAVDPRAEFVRRRDQCWAAIRSRRHTCGQIS